MNIVKPYKDQASGKKEQIAEMFDSIANRYDFLNHFLSFGIDKYWRQKAISILKQHDVSTILDIATGTADFAIEAAHRTNASIEGIDISEKMISIGYEKIQKKKLQARISLHLGDAESLSFSEDNFNAVTVAFGVRNFENLHSGLKEMFRVLKKNGIVVILEFSTPRKFPVKQIYSFYFKAILPFFGKVFSKNYPAYKYLPESVFNFPDGEKFLEKLQEAGFSNCCEQRLTCGIASIYTGMKI